MMSGPPAPGTNSEGTPEKQPQGAHTTVAAACAAAHVLRGKILQPSATYTWAQAQKLSYST